MAGNETAVHAIVGSTSSGARARSGTRRRRRRRWIRRGEEARRRGARRRARTAVPAGDLSKRNMAAGCCGAKKQRLGGGGGGTAPSLSPCDGTAIRHGTPQPRKPATIAQQEMGFFCFDVLYCQLHQLDPPKAPNFSNEALWVAFVVSSFSIFLLCVRPSICPSRSRVASAVIFSLDSDDRSSASCEAWNRGDFYMIESLYYGDTFYGKNIRI